MSVVLGGGGCLVPARAQGLVVAGGVGVESSDELVAGEDRDPVAVGDGGDGQLLVAAADEDLVGPDGDGAAGADVAAVEADLGWQRPIGGAGFDGRGVDRGRCLAA